MSKQRASGLTPTFIAHQRQVLEALRDELRAAISGAGREETALQIDSVGETREAADDAEKFAALENDEALLERNQRRVRAVERALEKIEQGTYGLSDASGEPIPQQRLEAVPESLRTLAEQEAFEQAARRP